MGLPWLQAITCLACIFQGLHATDSSKKPSPEYAHDALVTSSLFGFRPCIDEDCSDLPQKRGEYHVEKRILFENLHAPEYPQMPSPSPDPVAEYCLPLHTSTVSDIFLIEKHHPDVSGIKQKVIEDLVRYVAHLSILDAENCDPAMKLLDFILLAAEAVRQDYITEYGVECNYTKIACGEYVKSSDYTEAPTTTSKSVDCPESVSPDYVSTSASYETPIPKNDVGPNETTWEDYAHDYAQPPLVGSVRGIPGVHYPNYTDVPVTSFSCADKKYVPGFYADLETGCQVFHVCYEHRRESFLCPVGTIFNQPILACDYWYSSNCSLSATYYEINAVTEEVAEEEEMNVAVEELISVLVEDKNEEPTQEIVKEKPQLQVDITKFLPVKAKVTEFTKPVPEVSGVVSIESPETLEVDEIASQIFNKIVSSATNVVSQTRGVIGKVSEHGLLSGMKGTAIGAGVAKAKLSAAAKVAVPVVAKAKLAAAAATVPVAKIAAAKVAMPIAAAATVPVVKIAAAKVAVPIAAAAVSVPASKVVAKAKLATAAASASAVKIAAKVAVPVAVKTKLAAVPLKAAAASIPGLKVAAAKTVVPVAVKTKLAGVSVKAAVPAAAKAKLVAAFPKVAIKSSAPLLKTKMAAAAVPLTKSKMAAYKVASAPLVKAKVALPIVKSSIAGSVPIVKAKLGAVAAISPLTKKALALGYMKLLKAKKLALVG